MVQYVLELGHLDSCAAVVVALRGSFCSLSLQKFSSNVVERCLKLGGLDAERELIVRELIQPNNLSRLLQVRQAGGWYFWGGGVEEAQSKRVAWAWVCWVAVRLPSAKSLHMDAPK